MAALAVLTPTASQAHLVTTRLGDFYDGALHPMTGFEFALPWLALVILAALQGPARGRWLILAFPIGLLAGATLSAWLPGLSFVQFVNIAAIAGIGLLVALAMQLPMAVFLGLSLLVGLANGYENGEAMVFNTDRFLFICGVTAIGYTFAVLALALATSFLVGRGGWRTIALRAGGSWIAAVGIMVAGFQLSGLYHT
ncbi:MAG TPA: HupE/UreJ family protein [Rhizomicrobium sp.]|nr:HupE/UreJ family protein [Rhizomicrobium sp.]